MIPCLVVLSLQVLIFVHVCFGVSHLIFLLLEVGFACGKIAGGTLYLMIGFHYFIIGPFHGYNWVFFLKWNLTMLEYLVAVAMLLVGWCTGMEVGKYENESRECAYKKGYVGKSSYVSSLWSFC